MSSVQYDKTLKDVNVEQLVCEMCYEMFLEYLDEKTEKSITLTCSDKKLTLKHYKEFSEFEVRYVRGNVRNIEKDDYKTILLIPSNVKFDITPMIRAIEDSPDDMFCLITLKKRKKTKKFEAIYCPTD